MTENLRKLAEDATPGPWRAVNGFEIWTADERYVATEIEHEEDAAFIAACSPEVIMALLGSNEEQEKKERCSECGRDLHGYTGPRCRYCDGTAE